MRFGDTDRRRSGAAIIFFFVVVSTATAQYGGGTGEADDPYLVYTAEHLNAIAEDPNDWIRHFRLMADIDLRPDRRGAKYFQRSVIPVFAGTFDGNGSVVSNMAIVGERPDGFFGVLTEEASVFDLGIVDADIVSSGAHFATGLLVGGNRGGLVKNCYSTGTVSGEASGGGLAGYNTGRIIESYSAASVHGGETVGGLIGYNGGMVLECYSTGAVTGGSGAGGLVGQNGATVAHCYSSSRVWGGTDVGGLIGTNTGSVTCCYSTGRPSGVDSVGGLVGDNSEGSVASCFWDISTSDQATSAGGTGLLTSAMHVAQTYLDAGWDWTGETENGTWDVWEMPAGGGYPVLAVFGEYAVPPLEGSGTCESPYLIGDVRELGAVVRHRPDAHYRLRDSLDLSGTRWATAVIPWFAGTFDGNGCTVSHLTIEGGGDLGFFGRLLAGAEVKDLSLVDVHVTGSGDNVGGLAGMNGLIHEGHREEDLAASGAAILGCHSGGRVSGNSCVGGLVGSSQGGDVADSSSSGSVSGNERVGGLAGEHWGHAVSACCSTAIVDGYKDVGGLVGWNGSYANVTASCSTGMVEGDHHVGGLVGWNRGDLSNCYSSGAVGASRVVGGLVGRNGEAGRWPWPADITNCYSVGLVTGGGFAGGLIGQRESGEVAHSFWDMETSGQRGGAGVGKGTSEMQTATTFVAWGICGDNGVWTLDEGNDYPRLAWEGQSGEPIRTELGDLLEGDGMAEDPYLIYTPQQLNCIGLFPCEWDKHFKLMADVDLSGFRSRGSIVEFNIIGTGWDAPFTGSFDGNGHTIANLRLEGKGCLGLFGVLGREAVVRDLGVIAVNISGWSCGIGGLAGVNYGEVTRCLSAGSVAGVGRDPSTGIPSMDLKIGGLLGSNYGVVADCYSTAAVTADDVWGSSGGLVGLNGGTVARCYFAGEVPGGQKLGGLVGTHFTFIVIASFWDVQVSGQTESGGGAGLSTDEMQTATTFLEAGWDFIDETENGTDDIWWILEGQDYPRLGWQMPFDDPFADSHDWQARGADGGRQR